MPELPEVETVCRGLEKSVKGKVFRKITLRRNDLRLPFPAGFAQRLAGAAITNISRRSKYILLENDNDNDSGVLVAHLGMSGRILVQDRPPEQPEKHDHVIMEFTDGSALVYNDARRFGLMTLAAKDNIAAHPLFAHLGPEPLSEDFNSEYLCRALKNRVMNIKVAIMDARIVVGVGNIYACESLFRSGILPVTPAGKIGRKRIAVLVKNIKQVLLEAIESGGSTLRDYVRSDGDLGYFQHNFAVYNREKLPCPACQTPIQRIKQQGRSTFYCPKCQR